MYYTTLYSWTRQRAEDYLKDSTILSDEECVSEIRRYIRWPGQACAYKIGELKLKQLRTQAQTQLGMTQQNRVCQ